MQHLQPTTETIVKAARDGDYGIPEFQRGFVWTRAKILELAESIARGFPVGSLLTWKSDTAVQRGDTDSKLRKSWIVDGQQRTTALCTIFGTRPEWWNDSDGTWKEHREKFDIRIDVKNEAVKFVSRRTGNPNRYVSVSNLLQAEKTSGIAQQIAESGQAFSTNSVEIQEFLQGVVTKLKNAQIPIIEIDDEVDLIEVAEIFRRLNSTGTRVAQADIYLGVLAALNPGWVNTNFITYRGKLEDRGFDIEPAFLFKSFTAIGAKTTRFKEVKKEFWETPEEHGRWSRTERAWDSITSGLKDYGIVNTSFGLGINALVVAAIFREKYPQGSIGPLFAWMLKAVREGHLSGQVETTMDRIINEIEKSSDKTDAVRRLFELLDRGEVDFSAEEFVDTGSRRTSIQRLLIYLIAYRNDARDWGSERYRIRAEANGNYRPEWHHIFPRKWLLDNVKGISEERIDSVANMAVISQSANRKIQASAPSIYVSELSLEDEGLLRQQAIPDPSFVAANQYEDWLSRRSERLAQEANLYIKQLRDEQ